MKYLVTLYYDRMMREVWEVEAPSSSEAKEKAYRNEGEFQGDKIVSGELIYDSTDVEELT